MDSIGRALKRFLAVVDSLECECDDASGYSCTIHRDRRLAREALAKYKHDVHIRNKFSEGGD